MGECYSSGGPTTYELLINYAFCYVVTIKISLFVLTLAALDLSDLLLIESFSGKDISSGYDLFVKLPESDLSVMFDFDSSRMMLIGVVAGGLYRLTKEPFLTDCGCSC